MATYHIWTMQLAQWRLAAENNIEIVDTTAKSASPEHKAFAPAMNDVMLYKEGRLSEVQYTDIYVRRLAKSQQEQPKSWKSLLKHERFAIACYCRAGEFCHRHLMLPKAKHYLESLDHTVIVEGELIKGNANKPKAVDSVSPPQKEVFTFFGKQDLFSNWNARGFTVKGVYFHTNECFMMYCKAKLFGDHATAEKILNEPDPAKCKSLGRDVTPFDEALWISKREIYVKRGCLQKVREYEEVKALLLSTGNKRIIEASKYDMIWGAGIDKYDPRITQPELWPGLNLHGNIWEEIRKELLDEVEF